MGAYLIRRVLWMIPTFMAILLLNFGILRLQKLPLSSEVSGSGAEEGTRNAEKKSSGLRNHLAKLRRTGNNLPALINFDGFCGKQGMLERLQSLRMSDVLKDSKRYDREVNLKVRGSLLIEPLAAVLADDTLKKYHGIASEVFTLCAYLPPSIEDGYTTAELRTISARNKSLSGLNIAFTNTVEEGFVISDTEYEQKHARILAWYETHKALYVRNGRQYTAVFGETGFSVFMGKLCTGMLYSDTKKRYVFDVIQEKWIKTLVLTLVSIVLAWGIAIPLGIRSARRINSIEDTVTTNILFFLWSMPPFFVGALLLHHFCTNSATGTALFPHRGLESSDSFWYGTLDYIIDVATHAFLPVVVLTYASFTMLSRYMRSNLLEQLNTDYVRTARAKGASEDQIVYGHSMRNSMVTMVTLAAGLLSAMFGGSIIVEIIFTIDGLGLLMLDAVLQNDAPLVMGTTVVSVALMMIGFLIADIMYAVVDPRIRNSYA